MSKAYKLISRSGATYESDTPGKLGGHRKMKIYGRLDCPSALLHLRKGHYAKHRVFFEDEKTAREAGYRPCSRCMPKEYKAWKEGVSITNTKGSKEANITILNSVEDAFELAISSEARSRVMIRLNETSAEEVCLNDLLQVIGDSEVSQLVSAVPVIEITRKDHQKQTLLTTDLWFARFAHNGLWANLIDDKLFCFFSLAGGQAGILATFCLTNKKWLMQEHVEFDVEAIIYIEKLDTYVGVAIYHSYVASYDCSLFEVTNWAINDNFPYDIDGEPAVPPKDLAQMTSFWNTEADFIGTDVQNEHIYLKFNNNISRYTISTNE